MAEFTIANYTFQEPKPLSEMETINQPAIYLVLAPNGAKPTPISVGQVGPDGIILALHPEAETWKRKGPITIALYPTPLGSYTQEEREALVKELRTICLKHRGEG